MCVSHLKISQDYDTKPLTWQLTLAFTAISEISSCCHITNTVLVYHTLCPLCPSFTGTHCTYPQRDDHAEFWAHCSHTAALKNCLSEKQLQRIKSTCYRPTNYSPNNQSTWHSYAANISLAECTTQWVLV